MKTRNKEKSAVAEAPNGQDGFSLISNEKLIQLYTTMVKCRMLEERARGLFKQRRFTGNYDGVVGQEAAVVGVAVDLLPEDTIGPSHGDFIASFVKGAQLDEIFCRLFTRVNGPGRRRFSTPNMGYAPLTVITPGPTIAAQLNIANGVALANKMMKNGKIAVTFSGAGSASPDLWHEALNFAGMQRLPIIIVCQNNLCGEPVTSKRQTKAEEIALKAEAYGFPGITVDGNDAVAVYRVASEAISRARAGGGPTLIECKTCRGDGHSELHRAKHRDRQEAENWKRRDPILNMETYLANKGLFKEELKKETAEKFNRELDLAVRVAERARSDS